MISQSAAHGAGVLEPRSALSGSDAPVGVMQSAENGRGNESGGTVGCGGLGARDGRVAIKSLMWPFGVVVAFDELGEQAFEMALVEDNDVIEQFPAQRAHEPFDVRVLPGTAVGGADFFDAAAGGRGTFIFSRPVVIRQNWREDY